MSPNRCLPFADRDKVLPLCLAPMVGLSHVALRSLVRHYMPDNLQTIWPTEMLSSRKLPNENLNRTPETLREQNEKYLVPQILGNDEKEIQESILKLQNWGADGIDINMGCPVQKALKHNYGVALMGDATYAAKVVEMAVKASSLPVSVKLRSVPPRQSPALKEIEKNQNNENKVEFSAAQEIKENEEKYLLSFAKGLELAGASWLCLHPRAAEAKRRGYADWGQIRFLKEKLSIPIIGNGDIQTAEDVLSMLEKTKCDMVMSGRALAARPWLMLQVAEDLGLSPSVNLAPRGPYQEGAEYGKALSKFIELCFFYFPQELALRKIKFYLRTTHVWLEFGHALMAKMSAGKNHAELKIIVDHFFSAEQKMYARTELRQ